METTIDKLHCDHHDLERLVLDICVAIEEDNWKPDLIVGPGRGGLLPGVMLSHYFGIPFYALNWSTRDMNRQVSEAALAEEMQSGLKVLLIDDICDTGETLSGIIHDWESNLYDTTLDLGGDIRVATLHYRRSCDYEVDYIGEFITDEWVVYPWESWWG